MNKNFFSTLFVGDFERWLWRETMKIDKGFRIMMVMWLLGLGFAGLYVFQNRSCGGDSFCLAVKREDYYKQMSLCLSGALSDLRSMRAGTECLDNVTAKIKRDPDYKGVGLQ